MATTTPDNLVTPNPGDPYNLVADLASFAGTVQTALTRRANSYLGTAAQRIAFTTAPVGSLWQDTDGVAPLWRRDSSGWVEIHPATSYSLNSANIAGLSWTVMTNAAQWTSSGSTATWSNGYVVPRTGIYSVSFTIHVSTNISMFAAVKRNNTTATTAGIIGMSATTGFSFEAATTVNRTINLNAGDVLTPAIYTNATGGPYGLVPASTSFSIVHVR